MQTYIRTPQEVFFMPQRLLVPLFQRPYVWTLDVQWQPLWEDVLRQTNRILNRDRAGIKPHFLGAVVLQQLPIGLGGLQEWTVIDGQQRLTTLQLLLDAAHAVITEVGATQAADRLSTVIRNDASWTGDQAEKLKVWPTNRDRGAFYEVMTAETPVDYGSLEHHGEPLVNAHAYFAAAAREYLSADPLPRADALSVALLQGLQLVVIALDAEDDAQEIFETLNGRMTPLTAADLIKNLLFQRLARDGADTEALYVQHWQQFETAFWERQIGRGRVLLPRVSMFLSDYLVAATGEEIRPAEVFRGFKRFLDQDPRATDVTAWLEAIAKHAKKYEALVTESNAHEGDISEVALFAYRTRVLDTEVVNPVLLWLIDPTLEPLPAGQLSIALRSLESWLIRRAIVGVSTKNYNRVLLELLRRLKTEPRSDAGTLVRDYLTAQRPVTSYWPGDAEVRYALSQTMIYRRMPRQRLRMILEGVEDNLRHFNDGSVHRAEHRAPRGKTTIEHVLPQRWNPNWPIGDGDAARRDMLLHTIGNLTLLVQRVNSSVSNKPWAEKRAEIKESSVLHLQDEILAASHWDESHIVRRGEVLTRQILEIWPIPAEAVGTPAVIASGVSITVAALVEAGALEPGQVLRGRGSDSHHATVLPDGRLEVAGVVYGSPSGAAKAATGRIVNGWWFWLVDHDRRLSLNDVWNEFQAQTDSVVEETIEAGED